MLLKGQALKKGYKWKYFPSCDTQNSEIILLYKKNKQKSHLEGQNPRQNILELLLGNEWSLGFFSNVQNNLLIIVNTLTNMLPTITVQPSLNQKLRWGLKCCCSSY